MRTSRRYSPATAAINLIGSVPCEPSRLSISTSFLAIRSERGHHQINAALIGYHIDVLTRGEREAVEV